MNKQKRKKTGAYGRALEWNSKRRAGIRGHVETEGIFRVTLMRATGDNDAFLKIRMSRHCLMRFSQPREVHWCRRSNNSKVDYVGNKAYVSQLPNV